MIDKIAYIIGGIVMGCGGLWVTGQIVDKTLTMCVRRLYTMKKFCEFLEWDMQQKKSQPAPKPDTAAEGQKPDA